MVLKKETLEAKQKNITDGYLKRLGHLQAVRVAGPKPEPTSTDASIKPASSYAQMVQWKGKQSLVPKKQTTSSSGDTNAVLPKTVG